VKLLRKVKIDRTRDLAPGWIAVVLDTGGPAYTVDTVLYVSQPNNVANSMMIAEAIVCAINDALSKPQRDEP
jgi:hypothetical protein